MKTKEQLQKACGKPWELKIQRSIKDTCAIYGSVLACSRSLVLLYALEDFHTDGYRVIRTADICKASHGASQRVMDRIHKAEGVEILTTSEYRIALGSWPSLFKSLKALGRTIIVEGEDPDFDEFVIGKITRVGQEAVWVWHFDARGRLDKKPTRCPYAEITLVKFDCEYTNAWERYLAASKKRPSRRK
jgi:hypothetical protein